MYLFIEAPVVSLLYTAFGLKRRIELNGTKENAKLEIKEQIIKSTEPILDENANVKE